MRISQQPSEPPRLKQTHPPFPLAQILKKRSSQTSESPRLKQYSVSSSDVGVKKKGRQSVNLSKLLVEEDTVIWPIQKFKSLILLQKNNNTKALNTTQSKFNDVTLETVTKLLNLLISVPVPDREELRRMCPYCFASAPPGKRINVHMVRHEDPWISPDAWLKDYAKRRSSTLYIRPYIRQYIKVMSSLTKAVHIGLLEPTQVAHRLEEAINKLVEMYVEVLSSDSEEVTSNESEG